jgi:hypothetical protein
MDNGEHTWGGEELIGGVETVDRGQLRKGAEVVGTDGETIGSVGEVRERDFLLDRPMARDLYVPLEAISIVDEDQVVLDISAEMVDDQDWESPPLM